ncbi:MAG: xanthine dehydrogenase family protein subunit M [Flavitalea sp.]
MKPFKFQKTKSVSEAVAGKNEHSRFVAGGTNLVDLMKKHISEPDVLVDVTAGLSSTITQTTSGLRIGAMARNSAVANDVLVKQQAPLISKAILAGASPQIRNMASTGGNLLQRTRCPYFYDISLPCNKRKEGSGCGALESENRTSAIIGHSEHCVAVHPSDMCVAMSALDANVIVTGKDSKEATIPFKDFHRLPGDNAELDNTLPADAVITAVDIPKNKFSDNNAYVKVRDRDSYAFALISVAAGLQLEGNRIVDARLASGGVAHKPWRWYEAEKFLAGKEAIQKIFSEAAEIAIADTKPLAGNKFKVPMLKGAIEVALQNCLTIK